MIVNRVFLDIALDYAIIVISNIVYRSEDIMDNEMFVVNMTR